jgi:hypothetical protein
LPIAGSGARSISRSFFSRVLKAGETCAAPGCHAAGNAGALAIAVDGKRADDRRYRHAARNVVLEPEALLAGTAVQG